MDALQQQLAAVVERSIGAGDPPAATYGRVRAAVGAEPVELRERVTDRPRLTEGWFCCAEPTAGQLQAVGSIEAGAAVTRGAPARPK